MRIYPFEMGGASEDSVLASGAVYLRDLSAQPRFGLKGPGSREWLVAQGVELPEINNVANGVLRLGQQDIVITEGAANIRTAWGSAEAPKGYDAWRDETWAWMHLSGPYVPDVLAKVCPVDLSPKALPNGRIAQTRVGYVEAIIWHHRHADEDGFAVFFDIAASAFFANAVRTAAHEFQDSY